MKTSAYSEMYLVLPFDLYTYVNCEQIKEKDVQAFHIICIVSAFDLSCDGWKIAKNTENFTLSGLKRQF